MFLKFFSLFSLVLFLFPKPSLATPSPKPTPAAELYLQALAHTQSGDYAKALPALLQAKNLYSQSGLQQEAFLCEALASYLRQEQKRWSPPGKAPPPVGMQLGWLLQDFNYSGLFFGTTTSPEPFKGILILSRKVRDISLGPKRSIPVWGTLDVTAVPLLRQGEEVAGGTCEIKGKGADPRIAAILQVKGETHLEKFTKVVKAWRLNTKTSKIEEVPTETVQCINVGLGV